MNSFHLYEFLWCAVLLNTVFFNVRYFRKRQHGSRQVVDPICLLMTRNTSIVILKSPEDQIVLPQTTAVKMIRIMVISRPFKNRFVLLYFGVHAEFEYFSSS